MNQQQALNILMMGKNVYLTGQAGSGKTYLLNKYIRFLRQNKVNMAVTASTGIAATHINGSTIHAWSGIGIKSSLNRQDLARINRNSNKREKIQNAKVLIIDEISMLHSYRLDMVDSICRYIKRSQKPFGGMQVIFCGDFFQLPPIQEKGDTQIPFAYKAKSWEELDLKVCYLDEQHRQLDDDFLKLLNDIRSQDVTEYTFEKLQSRMNISSRNNTKSTKLYTHNIDVDTINEEELDKIDKKYHRFTMVTKGKKELVEVLKKGCLAPAELMLKEGALVIFIKNNPSKGYINGTLGKVVSFNGDGYPVVKIYNGKEIIASPSSWQLEEGEKVIAEIGQIPLRLAWAITVHKSQGMSLDAAEIDLSKSFVHGMGYVALSRVKSLEGISLLGINQNALMVNSEIAEQDKKLKKQSQEVVFYLDNMDKSELELAQKSFLVKILMEESDRNDMFDNFLD